MIVYSGSASGLGITNESSPDAGNFVGCNGDPGPRPAADNALIGSSLAHGTRYLGSNERPIASGVASRERAERLKLMTSRDKLGCQSLC